MWALFMVSEGESMTIMVGSNAPGRHVAEAGAESLHPYPLVGSRESETELVWAFETPKPTSNDTPPPARPHLLILPKQFHHREPNIPIYQPIGTILIQSTTNLFIIVTQRAEQDEHLPSSRVTDITST